MGGRVDPDLRGQRGRLGRLPDKAFGVRGVGCVENACTLDLDAFGVAEVDGGRGVEAKTRVAVLVVVPLEEALAERAAVLD